MRTKFFLLVNSIILALIGKQVYAEEKVIWHDVYHPQVDDPQYQYGTLQNDNKFL